MALVIAYSKYSGFKVERKIMILWENYTKFEVHVIWEVIKLDYLDFNQGDITAIRSNQVVHVYYR